MRCLCVCIVVWICISATEAQVIFPKKANGIFGYIDTTGAWVIQPQFSYAGKYVNSKAIAIRNDSFFLIYKLNTLTYLPGLRNYQLLTNDYYAIQNKSGKWALSDDNLHPISGFDYNSILYQDSFFLVSNLGLWGLISQENQILIPIKYTSIEHLGKGNYKAAQDKTIHIYHRSDAMRMVLEGAEIVYNPGFPNIYSSSDVKTKKTTIYNLKGDQILECTACKVEAAFGNFVFVKTSSKVWMLDVNSKEIRDTLSDMKLVMISKKFPPFMYLKHSGELFADNASSPFLTLEPGSDSVYYASDALLYVEKNGKLGLFDFRGKEVIPASFDRINLLDAKMAEAIRFEEKYLYDLRKAKPILNCHFAADISIDSSRIIVYQKSRSKVYEINSNLELLDSVVFTNLKRINAGRKAPLSMASLAITQGMDNRNFSKCTRWFRERNYYGLIGLSGDTILKPSVYTVRTYNDSLDIISYKTGDRVLMSIEGLGLVNSGEIFAIINNTNGKFVIKPSFGFMDYAQMQDSTSAVARVINGNGTFFLLRKSDFNLLRYTASSYISPEKDGYMRIFYKAKFTGNKDPSNYAPKNIPHWINTVFNFAEFGQLELKKNKKNSVYVIAASVNAIGKDGALLWSDETAKNICFLESGLYDNFIAIDQKNNFGVMHAYKGNIIPFKYSIISRLIGDDHYFVLRTFNVKYGYVDAKGNELTEAVFRKADVFHSEYAWAELGDSLCIIDSSGAMNETGLKANKTTAVTEGISAYRTKKGWIFVDIQGNQIDDRIYRLTHPFCGGSAAVMYNGNWGLINEQGEWLLQPEFASLEAENKTSLVFSKGRTLYFFARNGIEYQHYRSKGEVKNLGLEYYMLDQNTRNKVVHTDGTLFRKRSFAQDLRSIHDTVYAISNSRILVSAANGKKLYSFKHRGGVRAYDKGSFEIQKHTSGDNTITCNISEFNHYQYPDIFPMNMSSFNLIRPKAIEQINVVNMNMADCYRHNAFVYECKFSSDGKYFKLCDSLGNYLSETKFLKLQSIGNGLFKGSLLNDNSLVVQGIINSEGIWVLQPKFKSISAFSAGIAVYAKESDYQFADGNGKLLTDQSFIDYYYSDGYYCLLTEYSSAWWNPSKGWLSEFSR